MLFCPLSSGSKGNSVLLKTAQATVLFDAGLSARNLKNKLEQFNIELSEIDAIFISHEHHDHTAGVRLLGTTHTIPIIANYLTAEAIVDEIGECPRLKIFTTDEPFDFLDLHILPFSIRHDGIDPVAFTVETEGKKIGICTDLGLVTKTVLHNLSSCDLLYIEANHQVEMVHASSRNDLYKRRVLSTIGHLSNEQAGQTIVSVASEKLQMVYLAHMSLECNTPQKALQTVSEILDKNSMKVPLRLAEQQKTAEALLL